ncbi:MAG: HD domain-containing protein [archaeon]
MADNLFKQLSEKVEKKLARENRCPSHDYEHIKRVIKNAKYICDRERGDWKTLKYAALLHDVEYSAKNDAVLHKHHVLSARAAGKLLKGKLPPKKIKQIKHAIIAHSRKYKSGPKTLEAKILYDADKLEAYGYLGAARYMIQSRDRGRTIKRSCERYLELADEMRKNKKLYFTRTGRKLARRKMKKGFAFIKKVLEEMKRV